MWIVYRLHLKLKDDILFVRRQQNDKKIKKIFEEYVQGLNNIIGEDLESVILYGSYARGEQDKDGEISDIDIMILVKLNENKIKKIEEKIIDYTYDLDLKYDVLLSPIIESITNYNKMVRYIPFYKNVKKEGIFLGSLI